jgi:mevalonate kinase
MKAYGKVILLGEHSVVYGHPALAGAIADGVTVETRPGSGRLEVPAWDLSVSASDDKPSLARAYAAIRDTLGVTNSAHDFVVTFHVPTGAGLGSSAAMAVAVARALAPDASNERIANAAMASETVIHGKPSGLDHTVALLGGFGVFTRAHGLQPVRTAQKVTLVIGHTGRERDTKGRVSRVAELHAERGDEVRARFEQIVALVNKGVAAVERGAWGELGEAMNENQRHLEALEVSCPEIERMCAMAADAGAVGAKLTGGGGGGCVIALAPGRESAVRDAWQRGGFHSFVTRIG